MSVQVNDIDQARQFLIQVKEWQSEINTQEIDLMFFQRILDIYGLKAAGTQEAKDLELLKHTLSSFLDTRFKQLKKLLSGHEVRLMNIIEDRVLLKDREIPFMQKDMEKEIQEHRSGYAGLKNELYDKVEQLKHF